MRKIIIGTILIVIVSFASFLGIGIVRKIQIQKIVNEKIARFPSFSFLTLTNEKFNSSLISKGPVLVMHFHPECEHCQWEIDEMFKSPHSKIIFTNFVNYFCSTRVISKISKSVSLF